MFKDSLRSCRNCGIGVGKIDYLCTNCWRSFGEADLGSKLLDDISLYYLWLWKSHDVKLSRLLYDFKNSGLRTLADRIVCSLIRGYPSYFYDIDLIVYPCKSNYRAEHARVLAESFSRVLSVKTRGFRLQEHEVKYKYLSRLQRYRQRLPAVATEHAPQGVQSALFVDDILTTGATLVSAKKQYPAIVKACVIAYRAPLSE